MRTIEGLKIQAHECWGKVYIWERMKSEWPPLFSQRPHLYLLHLPQSLCFVWNVISLLCPLRPYQSFCKVTEYLLCAMHQGKEAGMGSWLNGIMGMLFLYWKSRQESGILPRFFHIKETCSIIAAVAKIDILNNQKSVTTYLVPCDMITASFKPGLNNQRKYSFLYIFFFSTADLLLFWKLPSVVPVTFASR